MYTNVLLMPRFERILDVEFSDREVPHILGVIIGSFRFFFDNFYVVVPPLGLGIGLLEAYSPRWRRIRPMILKILRWLAVILTLLGLLALATSALAVVPMSLSD